MTYNKAILQGTITTDISLSTTNLGKSIAVFGMATSNSFKTLEGEKKTEPIFHRIVAWGKLADIVSSLCKKGDEVLVDGKIINKKYTKKDGSIGFSSQVYLEKFQLRSKIKVNKAVSEKILESKGDSLFDDIEDIQL